MNIYLLTVLLHNEKNIMKLCLQRRPGRRWIKPSNEREKKTPFSSKFIVIFVFNVQYEATCNVNMWNKNQLNVNFLTCSYSAAVNFFASLFALMLYICLRACWAETGVHFLLYIVWAPLKEKCVKKIRDRQELKKRYEMEWKVKKAKKVHDRNEMWEAKH